MTTKNLKVVSVIIAALVAGIALGGRVTSPAGPVPVPAPQAIDFGARVEPFYGANQAGIETSHQANLTIVAYDLNDDVGRDDIGRMMRLLTDDAARLTQGKPTLNDSVEELAEHPAGLTITFGFGYGAFAAAGLEDRWPLPITDLPAYRIDRLEDRWSGGDVVIAFAGDNPMSIYHAVHEIGRNIAAFATTKWIQRGFLNPAGIGDGETSRNLFGQIDGTANPDINTDLFDQQTWSTTPAALAGGTTMVVRRVAMELPTWDKLSRESKEETVGRDLPEGAPLSGGSEKTPMDFDAQNDHGEDAIAENAHSRVAFAEPGEGITRRGYNYDDGLTADGIRDLGLVFVSYQADINQFLRIQEALANIDSLNQWTHPIGSALFVVPPGVSQGGWIGETFFK